VSQKLINYQIIKKSYYYKILEILKI